MRGEMNVNGGQSNVGCARYFYVDGIWCFCCDCLWGNPYLGALLTSKRG